IPAPRILLGYSLGARLALHALTTAPPGLWQAAILLAPHPGLPDPAERATRLAHDQTWADRTRLTPWPEVLNAWNAQPVLAGGPSPSASESWRPEIAAAFEGWSLGHQPSLLPALAQTRIPLLWITGARDLKFTALAAQAAALSPHIRHHILPACGHRLLHQAPGEIRTLISRFLQNPPRPDPSRPAHQIPPASA
ncbi:MAG: alpha/beta fold hydrolase, partial [Verrucomicrobiota bacterium]